MNWCWVPGHEEMIVVVMITNKLRIESTAFKTCSKIAITAV